MTVFDDQGHLTPWFEATWKERCGLVAVYAGTACATIAGLLAILVVFGMMMEGLGRHYSERDSCLKRATNGYEAKQCR